jgi:hypothetical protein
MEDNSASSFAAPGGSEASASETAEAGSSHEVLMPGTSQVNCIFRLNSSFLGNGYNFAIASLRVCLSVHSVVYFVHTIISFYKIKLNFCS